MKRCPICKTRYSDDAEFCAKCKALLEPEKPAPSKAPDVPTNYKKLVISIGSTVAFMLIIAIFIWLLSKLY